MISRALAHSSLLTAALMSHISLVKAGVWYSDPFFGVATDYSTNPGLLYYGYTAETHAAVLVNAPTTYQGNGVSLSIQPNVRISNSSGYSSLASDYAHLNVIGRIDGERNSLTLTGGFARDSSLYFNYVLNGSIGVRHDTNLLDVNWARLVTERLNFNFDINSSRVKYGEANGIATLSDYRYSSATPSLVWNAGELSKWTLQGNESLYRSLDAVTQSVTSTLQLGYFRQLTALWSGTVTAGYSHEDDKLRTIFGPFEIARDGTVFSANISRQFTLLTLTATASRSLTPSGYAFLSRQVTYELGVTYPASERLTFTGHARSLKSDTPQAFGPVFQQKYLAMHLSAAWLCAENWTLTLSASRVNDKYGSTDRSLAATGVTLQLSRNLNRINWQ
jgi:hypothetical protein